MTIPLSALLIRVFFDTGKGLHHNPGFLLYLFCPSYYSFYIMCLPTGLPLFREFPGMESNTQWKFWVLRKQANSWWKEIFIRSLFGDKNLMTYDGESEKSCALRSGTLIRIKVIINRRGPLDKCGPFNRYGIWDKTELLASRLRSSIC